MPPFFFFFFLKQVIKHRGRYGERVARYRIVEFFEGARVYACNEITCGNVKDTFKFIFVWQSVYLHVQIYVVWKILGVTIVEFKILILKSVRKISVHRVDKKSNKIYEF